MTCVCCGAELPCEGTLICWACRQEVENETAN